MLNKRFLLSWIFSALVMYSAFYVWHGMLTNDFKKIQFSQSLFLIFSAFAYLAISFSLNKLFELKVFKRNLPYLFTRALITGFLGGFILFVVSTVIGISFTNQMSAKNLIIDLVWQLIEQSLGAMVIAIVHFFVFVPDMETEDLR